MIVDCTHNITPSVIETEVTNSSSGQTVIFADENPGTVIDGSSMEILTFDFDVTEVDAFIAFYTTINFNVATTVDTDEYHDCELDIKLIVDDSVIQTLHETYGDGDQILTIAYVLKDLSIGEHIFRITFNPNGGVIK